MKTPFEALLESQRKIMDFWSETGKNVTDRLSEATTKPPVPTDFLQTWFDNSKKLWEEASKMNPLNSNNDQPAQFKYWAKLQKEFADYWINASKGQMPGFVPTTAGLSPEQFTNPMKYLQDWAGKSQEWVEKSLLKNMPAAQHQYLKNFKEVYEQMQKYWQPIVTMIKSNTYDQDQISAWIKKNDFVPIISKFMGYQAVNDPDALREEMQASYERFSAWMEENSFGKVNWVDQVKAFNNRLLKAEGSPFEFVNQLNNSISEGLDSYINISGQGKDIEMMKILKEIQFASMAYFTKTLEMQQQVYESSYKALPESLKHFSEKYQDDKSVPDFQDFFTHFVNSIESRVTETFGSQQYSTLQSVVARNATHVKALTEKMIELAVSDLPFLTNSFADEVALENQTLRKKIRTLEQRLERLEQLSAQAPPAPAKPKAPVKKRTRATVKKAKSLA